MGSPSYRKEAMHPSPGQSGLPQRAATTGPPTGYSSAAPGDGSAAAAAPAAAAGLGFAPGRDTSFVTGAYELSGNPMIDRMIQLERALRQNGALF